MRARLAPSRRLAWLFVGALAAVLGVVLFSESARVPIRTPLVPRAARGEALAIPLEGRESRRGSFSFRLTLWLRDPSALATHDELWLYLSSPDRGRALLGAEIRVRGSGCALKAERVGAISEEQPLVLQRSAACLEASGLPAEADLDLAVETQGGAPLFLLGFHPQPGAAPTTIQAPPFGSRQTAADVRGHFVFYPPTAPRVALLNQMWRLPPYSFRLVGLACLGVVAALAGCLVFPTRPRSGRTGAGAPEVLRAGAGAALFALSLALLYAALTPPLSAPDEPYHLLGFAVLAGDPELARDTVAWMGETHLWRIRQQPAERFRTIDVGHPYIEVDPELRPTEVAMRSAVLARLLRVVAPRLAGMPAPAVLLALRLLNSVLFALAVGAAAALAVATLAEPYPQWLSFVFLFVPSLPYFAMHVSETALLCSIYVLLAAGIAVLFLDGPRASWAGLPIGIATGLMLAAGRSPWPLTALVGAALAGRVLLGPPAGVASARRAALVFWAGLVPGALVFFLVQDHAYEAMTRNVANRLATAFPEWLRRVGDWLRVRPWALLSGIAAGALLEIALARPRAWLGSQLAVRARPLVRGVALALVALVLVSLALSLLVPYPELPLRPPRPLGALERVAAGLATMATMFRLAQPDFLLASSFWVGFGWLDTLPGPAFQALVTLPVALAFVGLLLRIAERPEPRLFLWASILAVGATSALVLYILATQVAPIALSGRYLIGWYLSILAVIGTALVFAPRAAAGETAPSSDGGSRAALLLALAGSIHVYCLCFILQRYF